VTPLIRVAATNAGREAVVAITLLLVVGSALLTEAVGLSTALGAFLAGLLIGESEYRHQIEVDIEPFKGLLLGLFFMTVGMTFDPALIVTAFVAVVVSVVGLIVLKAVVLYPLAVAFGVKRPVAAELAILLAGAGEFAFVVLTLARNAGLVQQPAHQFFVAVATFALLLTPLLAWGGRRARVALEGMSGAVDNAPDAEAAEYSDHVVIGGFGRIGRLIADVLEAEGIPYVGLDLDADLVAVERAAGRPVFYGDSARREMLERVGASKARAFVVTTDEAEAEEGMVRAIREVRPDGVIHARAKDQTHAQRLRAIGATSAVPETLEASLQLAAQVLAADGLPDTAIASRLARQRRAELELLQTNTASLPPGGSARNEGARPAPASEQTPP
jgi:CPA2 family monovalent cation:H+ antiporter-2